MPKRPRCGAGLVFHVINRGVRRSVLFDGPGDYAAFLRILSESADRVPTRLLAYALMPNHWHLVLWPHRDDELTRYVGWATLTHACRWQCVHGTRGTGPVYQGRFKAIPVENDHHFLTVCRYVERNPLRAGLVSRAEDWPWSSAATRPAGTRPALEPWPVPRPPGWLDIINESEPADSLERVQRAVSLSAPFGSVDWCNDTAQRLAWTTGRRRAGRPTSGRAAKSLRE